MIKTLNAVGLSNIPFPTFFIYVVEDDLMLQFQFYPENIRTPRDVMYADLPIIARNNPADQQMAGNNTLSFTLTFNGIGDDYCRKRVAWLESLAGMSDGYAKEAKKVRISLGSAIDFNYLWTLRKLDPEFSSFTGTKAEPSHVVMQLEFALHTPRNRTRNEVYVW